MGKALIQSHIGGGQYNVTYLLDVARANSQLAKAQQELLDLPAEIIDAQALVTAADLELFTARQQLDSLIILAGSNVDNFRTDFDQRTTVVRDAAKVLDVAKNLLNNLQNVKQLELQKEIDFLNGSIPPNPTIDLWCIDLTEDLTGEVGTTEIPGERVQVNIRPGGQLGSDPAHEQTRDGIMQPVISSGPAAVFFNQAVLPGWQKWNPKYRKGVITSFNPTDPNQCTIDLDSEISSQLDLGVNQNDVLIDVPILYLDCNEEVFIVGDLVVVEFEDNDFTKPSVIGFVDNPKPCSLPAFQVIGNTAETTGVLSFTPATNTWSFESKNVVFPTNVVSWAGDGNIVSWSTLPRRMGRFNESVSGPARYSFIRPFVDYAQGDSVSSGSSRIAAGVWYNGRRLTSPPDAISGCAIRRFADGKDYVVAVGFTFLQVRYFRLDPSEVNPVWEFVQDIPLVGVHAFDRQSLLFDLTGSVGYVTRTKDTNPASAIEGQEIRISLTDTTVSGTLTLTGDPDGEKNGTFEGSSDFVNRGSGTFFSWNKTRQFQESGEGITGGDGTCMADEMGNTISVSYTSTFRFDDETTWTDFDNFPGGFKSHVGTSNNTSTANASIGGISGTRFRDVDRSENTFTLGTETTTVNDDVPILFDTRHPSLGVYAAEGVSKSFVVRGIGTVFTGPPINGTNSVATNPGPFQAGQPNNDPQDPSGGFSNSFGPFLEVSYIFFNGPQPAGSATPIDVYNEIPSTGPVNVRLWSGYAEDRFGNVVFMALNDDPFLPFTDPIQNYGASITNGDWNTIFGADARLIMSIWPYIEP